MRLFLLLCLVLCLPITLHAQDSRTPYEIALQRIEEARESNVTHLHLNLGGLGLTEVPPEIGQLTNIQALYLYKNELTALPPEIGRLSNLQTLSLSSNQLVTLPPEIGQLSNLQTLSLSGNQLVTLPPEIGRLNNLQELNLDQNQLTNLLPEIGQLSNLQVLSIVRNHLVNLPAEVGQLNSLCILDLQFNNLQHLPTAIGNLNLPSCSDYYTGLYLDGNPLISPPPEVVSQGTVAVLAYLRNQAWYHIQRLIVAGTSGVGLLAMLLLGFRWKQVQQKSKKKREIGI